MKNLFFNHKYRFALTLVFSLIVFLAQAQLSQGIEKVSITVSDLNRSLKFYTEVLHFQKISENEITDPAYMRLLGFGEEKIKIKTAQLQLGEEAIELIQYADITTGRQIPPDSRSNDLWFQHIAIVTNNMDKAYELLRKNKVVHVSSSPQTLPDYIPGAAGIKAFYFRDPDGHNLEVIYFPKGKGKARWQEANPNVFLGIDHTAIGISDTDQSLDFYEKELGLQVGGNSENYGPEQEHLNQIFGAHLLITGLKANKGFGLEFLNYIAPPGGRQYPSDSKTNDLWHWHTTIRVHSIEKLFNKLKEKGCRFISDKIIHFHHAGAPFQKGFMLRDPDGHAVLLVE